MILLKLAAVILLLLIMINKKVHLGLALVISSVVMLALNGQWPWEIGGAVLRMVQDNITYTMTFTILFISILGYLMGRYKMLDRMISHLEQIVRSAKVTIMLAPTIIGLLLVTGGALMSCPVVDTLGNKLNLKGDKKAALNMIFRHGLYFAYPLSPTIILAAQLGGFELFDFIKVQIPLTILIFILGYFAILHGVKDKKPEKISSKEYMSHIGGFLLYSSPITVSILLTAITGWAFHYTLPFGIITAILVNALDAKKDPQFKMPENPLVLIYKGINLKMLTAVWGILLFKAVMGNLQELNDFVAGMVKGGIPVELIVIVAAGILAFSMGNFQPSLAIVYPLILPLAVGYNQVILFAYLMYTVGFIAYFTSPIHMCQVLTLEYFNTTMKDLYKNYLVFLPVLIAFMAGWYCVLKYWILV